MISFLKLKVISHENILLANHVFLFQWITDC